MVYLSQDGLRTERVDIAQSSNQASAPVSETLAPQDILLMAKQGNPKVIAALMNHTTKPHGILTHVARRNACLHVLLESEKIPNQQLMVNFVRDGIRRLAVEPIATIKVYGRQIGDTTVAWNHEIQLKPGHTSESSREIQVIQDPQPPADPLSTPDDVTETSIVISPHSETDIVQSDVLEPDLALPDFSQAIGSDWLDRPEAVVLIVFASLVILWQVYLDLLEEADADSFSSKKLAQRLGVSFSTVSRRKTREDFSAWSQSLDPDGIAWVYREGRFVPQS